ncbi:MAG: 30S ribosome-binding factor RbfA [Deltaproteobacteria bacterium]|nr:30S ribosome-binding factor RbfA [Deltaproteobacteria bacterium]
MAKAKTDDRRRPERVATRVREELSRVLIKELTDPRLVGVVITRVAATDDLSIVRVGITVMGDDKKQSRAKIAVKTLDSISGGLRKRMAPTLEMRRVPNLRFVVVDSGDRVATLDGLLAEVGAELKASRVQEAARAREAAEQAQGQGEST